MFEVATLPRCLRFDRKFRDDVVAVLETADYDAIDRQSLLPGPGFFDGQLGLIFTFQHGERYAESSWRIDPVTGLTGLIKIY